MTVVITESGGKKAYRKDYSWNVDCGSLYTKEEKIGTPRRALPTLNSHLPFYFAPSFYFLPAPLIQESDAAHITILSYPLPSYRFSSSIYCYSLGWTMRRI
jgi:hypothetical protein